MSSTDKRIVELQFDNKQFESGVKTSLQSLQNLDKNLDNIDGKSLNGLQNAINGLSFDGVEEGVNSLNDKFSAMGTFFRSIISNIADDIYGLGKKIISSTFGQILTGGSTRAQNLERANFMFRGLLNDDADLVAEAMKNANDAVLDTAYGLDEAAVVASQLLATGVELGDDMTKALTAISGAAAMTGSDYLDLGQIFIKVAGQGKVMGDELYRFSARGLNLAADIADEYGMTEEEVRKLVTKGAISFDMFYTTLYNKYAEHAKKANETFSGALSNVKAALNRIGAEIMTPYYTYARDVLNSIRPVLNAFKTEMAPVFSFISDKMKSISEGITGLLDGLFSKKWDSEANKWISVLSDKPKQALETIARIIENILQGLWNIGTTLKDIFGGISSAFINVFGQDILTKIEKITETFAKMTKPIEEVGGEVIKFKTGLQEGFGDEDTHKLTKNIDSIRTAFEGIFSVIKFGLKIGSNLVSFIGPLITDVLAPVGNWFFQVGIKLGSKLGEALSWFTGLFKNIKDIKLFGTTIGDVLGKVHKAIDNFTEKSVNAIDWFFDHFNELPKWFMSLWTVIKDFASTNFPKVVEFFESAVSFFKNVYKNVGESEILNKIVDFFQNLTKKVKEFVSGVKLTDILYAIAGAFIYFKETLEDVYKFLSPIFEGFFDMMKHFADVIKDTIIGSLSDDAGKNLLSGGILATLIMIFEKLRSVINSVGLKDLKKGVVDLLDGLGGVLKSYTRGIDAQNLWTLAKAIGVLAFSIAILSMLDVQKVTSVAAVLMMLGGGLAFFIKSFSTSKNLISVGETFDKFATSVGEGIRTFLTNLGQALANAIKLDSILLALDMFAAAVLILAGALKIISTIDTDKLGYSLLAMSAVLVLLGGMLAYVQLLANNLNDGKDIAKFAGTAASFAIVAVSFARAMLVMSGAIAALAATYERYSDGFWAGLAAIVAIMATLMITMKALQSTFDEETPAKMLAYAGVFVILTGSLGILALGLAKLAGAFALINLIDDAGLQKGFAVLIGVLGSIAIAGRLVKDCWKDIVALTSAFAIISVAMYPLAGALALFIAIPWDSLEKFAVIMGTFTLSISITSLALAAAAAILVRAGLDLETFGKLALYFGAGVALFGAGVLMLAESLVILGAAAPLLEKAGTGIAKGITAFIVALGEAAPQLEAALQNIIRSFIDNIFNGIKEALGPTIATLGETIISGLDNLQKYVPDIITKLANLIVSALDNLSAKIPDIVDSIFNFIGALGAAIKEHVGTIDPASFLMVNLFMIELGGIIIWFNALKGQLPGAIKTIGVVAILLALIVATFGVIDALGIEETLEIAIGISSVLVALSAAMLVASYVPTAAAIQGALGMAAFFAIVIGATAAIVTVLGLLNKISGFHDVILAGKDTLIILGEAIGGFIGAIAEGLIGGILNGVADGMVSLGQALSEFWSYAASFFEGIKSIDDSVLRSVGILAEVLIMMGGAEVVNAIANWLVGEKDFKNLKDKMVGLADVIVAFSEKVSVLSQKDLNNTLIASMAAKNLSELSANIPTSGGILKIFTGGKSMKQFAKGIDEFADVLINFATKSAVISALGTEHMDEAIEVGKRFSEFNSAIPVTQTGLWQLIAGKKDMPKFAKGMKEYADILVEFATQAQQMAALNAGAAIEDAISIGERFAEFNKAIPVTQMGALQAIIGKKDMPKFAEGMKQYGAILTDFAQNAKDMAALEAGDAIDTAIEIGYKFADFNRAIPITENGLLQALIGGQNMDLFATGMESFADGIRRFAYKFTDISLEEVNSAIDITKSIIDCLKLIEPSVVVSANNFSTALGSLANSSVKQMVDNFTGTSYQEVHAAVVSLFDGLIKTIKTYEKQFEHEGIAMVKSLTNGIYNRINLESASLSASMKQVGIDAVNGFINGAKSIATTVYLQYWEIGRLALKAAKEALDSNSPSREFEKLGMDSDIGMANGLTKYAFLVENSSAKVGNVAIDAISDSIDTIYSMLDDDLDVTPTITPVLDLSQIQNGIYGIDNLLSGVNGGSFGAVDRSVRSMYETNTALYNDSNVLRAIDSLNARLDNVATRIESMRVVLDNGTLVGEMAPGMDVELGNISTLTRRGVM